MSDTTTVPEVGTRLRVIDLAFVDGLSNGDTVTLDHIDDGFWYVRTENGSVHGGFFPSRFEVITSVTESNEGNDVNTITDNTTITIEQAREFPIGTVLTGTGEYNKGDVLTLVKAGVDSDGDWMGNIVTSAGAVAHSIWRRWDQGWTLSAYPVPEATTLTREQAAALPVGTVLTGTPDNGGYAGRTLTLDRAGVDSDGDFHGTLDGQGYGQYFRWNGGWTVTHEPVAAPVAEPEPVDTHALEIAQKDRQIRTLEAKVQMILDRMYQEAEDREWCQEFDRILDELGLPGRPNRERTFTVSMSATVTWDVDVEATSEDDAREKAEDRDWSIYSIYNNGSSVNVDDIDTTDVEDSE